MGAPSSLGFVPVIAQSRYNAFFQLLTSTLVLHKRSAAPLPLPPPVPAPPSSPPPSPKKDSPMFGVVAGVTGPQMAASTALA